MSEKPDLPPDSIEVRAARRVRKKIGFYIHALVFVLVNLGFVVVHLLNGRGPGLIWPWGIGLAVHGLLTFVSLQGEGVRERMIREEIERMKRDKK
ncbi:MAG: hypothetical protein Tsb007_38350 [Rhizobacter sp.]